MLDFTGLLKILGIIFLALYFGGPLVIWLTQKQAANPKLVDYTASLNQPAFAALAAFCNIMSSAGFELVGIFGLVGQTTNINTYLAYVIHRKNGDAGMSAVLHSTAGTIVKTVLEFSTRFSDQSSITTNNSGMPSVFVRPGNKPVYRFPSVTDPLRLYRLHQQLIARDKPSASKDVPAPGHEAARLVEGMQRELVDQLQTGIMRLDTASGSYRPTFTGAFRMTWKLLPPFKQIAVSSIHSQEARMIKTLESPGVLYGGQGS